MLSTILAALDRCAIANYRINQTTTASSELFFVKKRLDMRRIKQTVLYQVTVFHDFTDDGKEMRGSSTAYLYESMTPDEVMQAVSDAYQAAGNAKNPAFALYTPAQTEPVIIPGEESVSTAEAVQRLSAALFAADTRTDAFVNSAEVFAEQLTEHIVTSEGVDVCYSRQRYRGEFVVQCKEPVDVEQYFPFEYATVDEDALTALVAAALDTVCDRARADAKPAGGKYDIVLSGHHLATLLGFYNDRSSAQYVFARYSQYQPGMYVQGDDATGERLNLYVQPTAAYSEEGIPMVERALIRDGKLCFLHGPTRFCRYLGIEPTGNYRKLRLEGGTVPFEEMKKGCLYPVSFSDFQMDSMSGHFGGEIRLAYYYGENGVQLLTGGSINGSFLDAQKSMVFSLETYSDANYVGPLAVRLKNVSVSGE